ncbi:MAG: uroporphyrinogen decarboxylase family protein [bacterium]
MSMLPECKREPDFGELLKVLRREKPSRPVLYELYINNPIYALASGEAWSDDLPRLQQAGLIAKAYKRLGYDYANPWRITDFRFPSGERNTGHTISQNEGAIITDQAAFEDYRWPDPEKARFIDDKDLLDQLPAGMKFLTFGPGGLVENAVSLAGFENLCMMLMMEPDLARAIFDSIGERLVKLYTIFAQYESLGALVVTDDWGFKSQTFLSPPQMREFVIPWHRKIVAAIHAQGKPAILHSCGNPEGVMDDVIDTIGYDARHSYEDAIIPVEKAWDRWGDRIAILGGIDVDFISTATPEAIHKRCTAMLERTAEKGGYALGTGNSIPEYIPRENYFAMITAALDY